MIEQIKLEPNFSNLYRKTNYLTPIETIVNSIYEYDMKAAGFSVIQEYKLLSEKNIDKISIMNKQERNETIGLLKRDNKELVKREKAGICTAREDFIKTNHIKDSEILSIKNDAIFLIGRKAKTCDFGKYVHFVLKNTYTSYYNINGIEFYYNKREDALDVKKVYKNISNVHELGILRFLKEVFKYIEYDRMDDLRKYIIDYSDKYKKRELNKEAYREFNHEDAYRYKHDVDGYYLMLDDISEVDIKELNITFNYMFIILPIIQKYLF